MNLRYLVSLVQFSSYFMHFMYFTSNFLALIMFEDVISEVTSMVEIKSVDDKYGMLITT